MVQFGAAWTQAGSKYHLFTKSSFLELSPQPSPPTAQSTPSPTQLHQASKTYFKIRDFRLLVWRAWVSSSSKFFLLNLPSYTPVRQLIPKCLLFVCCNFLTSLCHQNLLKWSKAESEANITMDDLIASLAEHRSALISELKTLFKEVNDKLDGIQETVTNHEQHLKLLEENAESFHQHLEKVEDSHKRLQAENEKLHARLTELEVRGRRSNIRLVGISEVIEGSQPSLFFSQLQWDVFDHDTFLMAQEFAHIVAWRLSWVTEVGHGPSCSAFIVIRTRSSLFGRPGRGVI